MASTSDKSLLLAHETASSGSANNLTTTTSSSNGSSQLCEPVSPKPRARRKISLPWFRQSSFGLGSGGGGERKNLSKQNTIAVPETHKKLTKQNTIAFTDPHHSSEDSCEVRFYTVGLPGLPGPAAPEYIDVLLPYKTSLMRCHCLYVLKHMTH